MTHDIYTNKVEKITLLLDYHQFLRRVLMYISSTIYTTCSTILTSMTKYITHYYSTIMYTSIMASHNMTRKSIIIVKDELTNTIEVK